MKHLVSTASGKDFSLKHKDIPIDKIFSGKVIDKFTINTAGRT